MPEIIAKSLQDQPVNLLGDWKGYFRNVDPTVLPPNCLTFPSINCFIPDKDVIQPRAGKTLLGAAYTNGENWPIVGHKERFTTMGGIVTEVRVVKSDDVNKKDIIEVLYPHPVTGINQWYQITANTNPLTAGVHRYYFDDWFDTNLDPSASLRLPRLIWVAGTTKIGSWTGGIAPIVSVVLNTSITTTAGVSWASLGFLAGTNIIINGVERTITGGWSTDTLTLASTTGIAANDVAFAKIEEDTAPIAFDICRQNKNYMFYGNWKSRQLYMSNAFNRPASAVLTNSQAAQNDLVVSNSAYIGTGSHVYRVTIDSINPDVNEQSFSGNSGLNDARFGTSGYSALPQPIPNVYKVTVVANFTINSVDDVDPVPGAILRGGTSNALGRFVATAVGNAGGTRHLYGVVMISGVFLEGETINTFDGSATPIAITATELYYQDWVQYFKNNTPTSLSYSIWSQLTVPIDVSVASGVIDLTDDLSIQFANQSGHYIGDFWQLTINQGGADTFKWQKDGAIPGDTLEPITANQAVPQVIEDGLSITFTKKTGHSVGDFWDITVDQSITEAWYNFYYRLPVRRPGEGYVFQLPSNFWTMAPQEEEMYVNDAYGQWSYISTELSADLQSESVRLTPLKKASTSKVIFPYMIDYLDNDIIYVTENKTLDMIGRREFLELPQIGYLSEPVSLDFEEATFENGSMKYFSKMLFITSPNESAMFVYSNRADTKYWQPPQIYAENGILSIVENTLISHSNLRNQTFNMFTGSDDNGSAFTVRIRTPYNSYGDRWKVKNSSNSFIEGYITGNPPLKHTVYLGVNGCGGILTHDVEPIVCISPDRAPLGEGSLGSHSLGSDRFNQDSHFYELSKKYEPIMSYRFVSLELECTTKKHSYSILAMGLNAVSSNLGNNDLIPEETISRD